MKQIVLATGNAGKLREFQQMLGGQDIEFITQRSLGVSDAAETGLSFVENAILKARHACLATGLPAMADDSGIEVDALRGEPGIYSARYAGPGASDEANNRKLLEALAQVPEAGRTARFQCAIVFMRHAKDPMPFVSQGSWEGRILFEPCGSNGFGYDPLFYVPTHNCASAQLDPSVKNSISHRGQALRSLVQHWSALRESLR
ncbi:MAG: RdgB/HAM1 family non-canonical purine NTP pyrophosphatase [Pseudomonadales bacterium]|nr:RdgB/HAM1 family non-canonical purine NTP pyrophosphatase [Pseudomonadales bacterium]MCP5330337.1 RdgB/HAM1 family non-canonical purine NTP pyrophosphatase [Pseudomonadales bacterium]MCP5344050.1 RdgB/HAM1 family non-canonical purine NTP pyrophosphatase [Pseudomonadales bacterium]